MISRAELLKELLPALNEMFGNEYGNYRKMQYDKARRKLGGTSAIHGAASSVDASNKRRDAKAYKRASVRKAQTTEER